jgi:transposase
MHAGCLDETTAVSIMLTGGERSDMPGFDHVFAALPERHALEHGVMDKGYDSNAIRAKLQEHHINPIIPRRKIGQPPWSMIKRSINYAKLREKVARFFNRLKQFRRIATRYDKLGNIYLAFIPLVAACLIIK